MFTAQLSSVGMMTHIEASELCDAIGGTTVSYQELDKARREGFHMCKYGLGFLHFF